MPIINRTLSQANLDRFQRHFRFLPRIIQSCHGQLELAIRDNYLNLYFRGYSLAKVEFMPADTYRVSIHRKFWPGLTWTDTTRAPATGTSGEYTTASVPAGDLRWFFQRKHLDGLFKAIKTVGTGEESVFEQMLILDNFDRSDLIILDRQVRDRKFARRMDLLAARRMADGTYRLLVLEVKMGNNKELAGAVAQQLADYVNHIKDPTHFSDYRDCYQEMYTQKQALGLWGPNAPTNISLTEGVEGMVVVGGYSREAAAAIAKLERTYPTIQVRQFKHEL